MTDKLLSMIKERFPLKEKNVGAFASLKANGMKFTVSAYEAEGLGHVSVMTAKGFFGLMKMDTLIVNPKTLDLPLYSYDRILAMGNDTLIVELYDTMVEPLDTEALKAVNEANKDLPERDPGTHWYDGIKLKESVSKKGKKLTERFDAYTKDYTNAYLGLPAKPVTDAAAKREKANAYVEGLLKNGGPSTDVFK
ncbi:MAG: hypothetical protein IKI52_05430, partial [Clostridia bacterium]|nr:hypothetical protein [Clostridia bacterium]